jgi:hypothetical protein
MFHHFAGDNRVETFIPYRLYLVYCTNISDEKVLKPLLRRYSISHGYQYPQFFETVANL